MSSSQQIVFWTGLVFLASGLLHAGVWLHAGMPSLEGPVSWRKPMTFGFSTGVLFLSLTWVLGLLPQTARLTRQAAFFAGLLVAEVALIDMQQWRGVPSHFNETTAFDAAVFRAMGLLIVTASVILAVWTRALFRHALPTTPASAFAARAGMVVLNAGTLIGLLMAATEATALKPLHGVALHVLQAVPVGVWMLNRLARLQATRGQRWLVPKLAGAAARERHYATPSKESFP